MKEFFRRFAGLFIPALALQPERPNRKRKPRKFKPSNVRRQYAGSKKKARLIK